ncbi:MAG: hypothetical protein K6B75_00615 [Lachnospiraceae bacterium]|nr:hypothetical protein [Lachnospiraceae bacterium]
MYKGKRGLAVWLVAFAVILITGVFSIKYARAEEEPFLSFNELNLSLNEVFKLEVGGVTDDNATYVWSSSTPTVATVSARGYVYAKDKGMTVVTCTVTTVSYGTKSLVCIVNVRDKVDTVSISVTTNATPYGNGYAVTVGNVYYFSGQLAPEGATDSLFYEIEDQTYAFISANGILVAYKPGITKLTIYAGENKEDAIASGVRTYVYIVILETGTGEPTDKTAEAILTSMPTPTPVPWSTTTPTPAPTRVPSASTPTPIPTSTPIPTPTSAPEPVFTIPAASGNAGVDLVEILDSQTVVVVFGKPVIPATVLADGKLTTSIGFIRFSDSSYYGDLTGEFSHNNRVLTIKASSHFLGRYVVKVTSDVTTGDYERITRYLKILIK